MSRIRVIWWLACCVCLVVCGCSRTALTASRARPGSGSPVSLTVSAAEGDRLEFGRIAHVAITMHNDSDRAVLVTGLRPLSDAGADEVPLSEKVYGSVAKRPRTGLYEWFQMSQRESQAPIDKGLVLPGETVRLDALYRPLTPVDRIRVRYFISAQPYDGSAASLKPLTVYAERPEDPAHGDGVVYFEPFEDGKWRASGKTDGARPPRNIVVEGTSGVGKEMVVQLRTGLKQGGQFHADEARKTAARIEGTPVDQVSLTYSSVFRSYIVRGKDRLWTLAGPNQTKRGELLPDAPLELFTDADPAGTGPCAPPRGVRVKVGEKQVGFGPESHPANGKLWETYPVFYGDGMYTRGEFISVHPDNLKQFLRDLGQRGGRLTMHYYFFRSRYYPMILPGRGRDSVQQSQ